MSLRINPIGIAKTCFTDKFGIPRQAGLAPSAWGQIELSPPFNREEALRGIETFSHLYIFFHSHKSQGSNLAVRPPKLGGNTKMGVFATRSPFRPNPICLSLVKLEKVDKDKGVIYFSNHDILNESPVVDIKPYIPKWDSINEASNGWTGDEKLVQTMNVTFCSQIKCNEKLKNLIKEVLSHDPRPGYQKDKLNYHMQIADKFILFTLKDSKTFHVNKITQVSKTKDHNL